MFDLLAARPDIDLHVLYSATTIADRTWSVPLHHPHTLLRAVRVPGLRRVFHHDYVVNPGILGALRSSEPAVVVVAGWSTFAGQAALLWCRLRGIPYVLQVESHDEGARPSWRRKNGHRWVRA